VADCERTVKEVVDHYGQLDVLVSLFRLLKCVSAP